MVTATLPRIIQGPATPTAEEAPLADRGTLADVPSSVRAGILDAAQAAVGDLAAWAGQYPVIRAERIQPLCLSVAAAAPFASAEVVAATARLSLWVFTLDDLFDESNLPEPVLLERARRYRAVARGVPLDRADEQLEAALREVRADLARFPVFATLETVWAEALCGTVDGMAREYAWRKAYLASNRTVLPNYGQYVETGLYSIGAPPHLWAAVITTGDPSARVHLGYLRRFEREASICIRLANDLRSQDKEAAEGNVNSLVILEQQARMRCLSATQAHQHAERLVAQEIERRLEWLATLNARPRTASGQPEQAMYGIARFVCGFYRKYDYHTFTTPTPTSDEA